MKRWKTIVVSMSLSWGVLVSGGGVPRLAAQAAPVSTSGLQAARLEVATALDGNRASGVTTSLTTAQAGRFYIFTAIANPTGAEAHVIVGWRRQGETRERGRVTLSIPAQRRPWTTFARAHVSEAGAWEAVVRSEDGEVLDTLAFTVE